MEQLTLNNASKGSFAAGKGNEVLVIVSIQHGDHVAFNWLMDKYFFLLQKIAYPYVGSVSIAEEMVQEVFLKVWTNRDRWTPSGSVKAYLIKAVINQSINHARDQRLRLEREQEGWGHLYSGQETPLEELEYLELKACLNNALADIPDRRREIFLLNRSHGYTYKQIAERLNISTHTVDTQIRRTLNELRKKVIHAGYEHLTTCIGMNSLQC